jgi:hypothetical protein
LIAVVYSMSTFLLHPIQKVIPQSILPSTNQRLEQQQLSSKDEAQFTTSSSNTAAQFTVHDTNVPTAGTEWTREDTRMESLNENPLEKHSMDFPWIKNGYSEFLQRMNETRSTLRHHREQALQRAHSITPLPEYFLSQAFTNAHPVLTPLDPRYAPHPEWRHSAMADINIAGHAKAGTSQLYTLLTTHRDTLPLHPVDKEHCVLPNAQADSLYFNTWRHDPARDPHRALDKHSLCVQEQLYRLYADNHERMRHIQKKNTTLTVNGCIWASDLQLSWYYLKPDMSQKKYIFLLRDPADLLYSFYTYFVMTGWDAEASDSGKTQLHRHTRSPELFHHLLLSGTTSHAGRLLLHWLHKPLLQARQLVSYAGRQNVLFLRNEDMLPDRVALPDGGLDQVSLFTGLDLDGFDTHRLHMFENCGTAEGVAQNTQCQGVRPAGPKITQGRPMLPETRMLIYLMAHHDCQLWHAEFGIAYPDCLNILETTVDL